MPTDTRNAKVPNGSGDSMAGDPSAQADIDAAALKAEQAAARRAASSNRVARYFLRSRHGRAADDRSGEQLQPRDPETHKLP